MTTVFDYDRRVRLGMPETVFCEGKEIAQLDQIIAELRQRPDHPTLFTRLWPAAHARLAAEHAGLLDYDGVTGTAFLHGRLAPRAGRVAVVTAGTSDLRVAGEAARTLEFMGIAHQLISDVGVAGIHRLFARIDEIRTADVVIAVAGWDAALASVLGGLVAAPVIGVPTSVGYGVAAGGKTSLNSMLASCGQGVLVVNIDNGFGAACGAVRILNALAAAKAST
ncbi:MAG: nickel pincer cofactor biosynthesis protein LarB [Caulobacterales bacterium]